MSGQHITLVAHDYGTARDAARHMTALGLVVTFEARGDWNERKGDIVFAGTGCACRLVGRHVELKADGAWLVVTREVDADMPHRDGYINVTGTVVEVTG